MTFYQIYHRPELKIVFLVPTRIFIGSISEIEDLDSLILLITMLGSTISYSNYTLLIILSDKIGYMSSYHECLPPTFTFFEFDQHILNRAIRVILKKEKRNEKTSRFLPLTVSEVLVHLRCLKPERHELLSCC